MEEKDIVVETDVQEQKEVKFFESSAQSKQSKSTKPKTETKPEVTPESKSEYTPKPTIIEFEDTDIFKKIKSDYKLESVYENVNTQNQPKFAMGDMILIFKKK